MEVKLTLSDDATSENVEISGKLNQEEKQALEGYSQEASQLLETSFVKQSMPVKVNVNLEEGQKPKYSTDLPNKESIYALLHILRPIILSSEYCSFEKTAGFIGKNFKHDFIWKTLKLIREQYEGKKLQSLFNIQSENLSLISEEFLFKWLNAYRYHRDLLKQEDLEPILKFLPRDSVDAICTFLLSEKIQAIFKLNEMVNLILGNKQKIRTHRKK